MQLREFLLQLRVGPQKLEFPDFSAFAFTARVESGVKRLKNVHKTPATSNRRVEDESLVVATDLSTSKDLTDSRLNPVKDAE